MIGGKLLYKDEKISNIRFTVVRHPLSRLVSSSVAVKLLSIPIVFCLLLQSLSAVWLHTTPFFVTSSERRHDIVNQQTDKGPEIPFSSDISTTLLTKVKRDHLLASWWTWWRYFRKTLIVQIHSCYMRQTEIRANPTTQAAY